MKKKKFGTLPVLLTSLSTILGAILFLRFGWAVGNLGFMGVLLIILLGHLITIPTSMAVAEIATNQKVLGGGAYHIISRSFGLNIGGTIGITLYISQAISVAFYIIAFAEAFEPLIDTIKQILGISFFDKRFISYTSMAILSWIVLRKTVNIGMNMLYIICAILFISILMFLFGIPQNPPETINLTATVEKPKDFFYVFIIIFPAFTGLAAGLGLSGELKNPQKSIPKGTILATFIGMIVYVLIALKFLLSSTPTELTNNQLVMSNIALWGPIIPIGLAAATLSSAAGSILIAPRTLQAISSDGIFPQKRMNKWLSKERFKNKEPVNASLITVIIAFIFISIGDINSIAQIISMFFLITYGAICTISFLEFFTADISYRPTFKTKWYFSLLGAVLSGWIIFAMNIFYAIASLFLISIIYFVITYKKKDTRSISKLLRGVIFQLNRRLQIFSQKIEKVHQRDIGWRPFAVCVSKDSFERQSAFELLRWISYKYGHASFIHFVQGYLNNETYFQSKLVLKKLLKLSSISRNSQIYVDTIISPSITSALAQVIQLSGISGSGYNMLLFEFYNTEPNTLQYFMKNYKLLKATHFDVGLLSISEKGFGSKKELHVWIGPKDYDNASLMILMSYIILGHPDWKNGKIRIYAAFHESQLQAEYEQLKELIVLGRLPISINNIELITYSNNSNLKQEILLHSENASLTILGFNNEHITENGFTHFTDFSSLGNILFLNAFKRIEIK